jgi:L-threonylcarbamoyladenylate synthase
MAALIRSLSSAAFAEAARIIGRGGLVIFPTETYYGLAVDPFSEKALANLYALKNRPATKPVLTLVDSEAQLERLTKEIPVVYQVLMDRFWPGPLTLLFKARPGLSDILTAGTGTIGVRISSLPAARLLTTESGGIITATSANLSGRPPAATATEAIAQLGSRPDLVLDGGPTAGGQPSTILTIVRGNPVLVREGMVAAADIRRVLEAYFPGLPFGKVRGPAC